jgi:hypothetical protein
MSGDNHVGKKSPDICDGADHRRFLCSQSMKHKAMKGYEAQGSSLESNKERRTSKCPRAEKNVPESNIQKKKGHQNFHWQIGLLLKAAVKTGKDTEMSKGGEECH